MFKKTNELCLRNTEMDNKDLGKVFNVTKERVSLATKAYNQSISDLNATITDIREKVQGSKSEDAFDDAVISVDLIIANNKMVFLAGLVEKRHDLGELRKEMSSGNKDLSVIEEAILELNSGMANSLEEQTATVKKHTALLKSRADKSFV